MAETQTKETFRQRISSRKFIVYMITVAGVGVTAWIVKDAAVAGVVVAGLVAAGLIYSESNVRTKIKIGESEITTGGNGNGVSGDSQGIAASPGGSSQ